MESESKPVENEIGSNINIHEFSDVFLETETSFYVLQLLDSLFVWIGTSPDLSNLAVAMQTKYDSGVSAVSIMGDMTDPSSVSLAQKLTKKTNKQVFVSHNLPQDLLLLPLVEKRIFAELAAHPEKF